ncbi:MAG: DPP IV N-terminal domain-containing protein, partial [Siphonobacter sp.]
MKNYFVFVFLSLCVHAYAQPLPKKFPFGPEPLSILDAHQFQWTPDGNGYLNLQGSEIKQIDVKTGTETVLVSQAQLTPASIGKPLVVQAFEYLPQLRKVLVYTNARRVWRYATRGDYWLVDLAANTITKLGKNLPESTLMFAKVSPDGQKVAYVSKHNLYVEDLKTGQSRALTTDGTDRIINGTFDWVYEEELDCRDGFRWSPDSKRIAFWSVDARQIRNFLMINNTDSLYSFTIPVEYPKAGERFSFVYVKTVEVESGKITPIEIPGEPDNTLLPRMEWVPNSSDLLVQQLDRRQQVGSFYWVNGISGQSKKIMTESDAAWVDVRSNWAEGDMTNWHWLPGGKEFLYMSEKGGWRQLYKITPEGKETLLSPDSFDIIKIYRVDDKNGYVYFAASPTNATQQYLYRLKLDGKSKAERLTPATYAGTNDYEISPNGLWAQHQFSSANILPVESFVSLPAHKPADGKAAPELKNVKTRMVEFFQVKTAEGVTMDGWMIKPANFDSTKKYPVVFYVYGEPAATTVNDRFGTGNNFLFQGNMAEKGYIYVSLDNRGTPAPKGRAWRKAIYRNNGAVNAKDQALGAQEILKWPFIDKERVAIWGWSGGGMSTLNALMQYPEIYQTGIAIAAVTNLHLYDNVYEERYMGIPSEAEADYVKGSPINHVKNLKGNLLYIHGTGDDNVHYQNGEVLIK